MTVPLNSDEFDRDDSGGRAAVLARPLPACRASRVRTWISVAMVSVIFLAGVVCGATALRPKPTDLKTWGDLLERVAKRMKSELDLSEEQQVRIGGIMRAHQPRLNQIRARTIAEMRTELQQVIEDSSAVLTPQQNSRFLAEAQRQLDRHFPANDQSPRADETSKAAPAEKTP
jgi:hypothetical protein